MPGDVSKFTSVPPQRSVFHREWERASDYLIERVQFEIPEADFDKEIAFPMDLNNYHLCLGITMGVQFDALNSRWKVGNAVATTNPVNPRTNRVVEAWEAVRWTNGVLMAAFEHVEVRMDDERLSKLSSEDWFFKHETTGTPGRVEDADMGISDNLNLRSNWARDLFCGMGEVPFPFRVKYPERGLPLVHHPKVELRFKLRPKSYLINVDADWAQPPEEAPVNAGDQTSAEITGYYIDEDYLNAFSDQGAFVFVTVDVARLVTSEVPRILSDPYQILVVSTASRSEWLPSYTSKHTFSVEPRFREFAWAFRSSALVDLPVWQGRPVIIAGTLQVPSGQSRRMRFPHHGGNQWFNFSGFHFGGESFESARVRRGTTEVYKDLAPSFRVAWKAYHDKATEHYFYMWPGSVDPESRDPAGSASEKVNMVIDIDPDRVPYDVEFFKFETYDNVYNFTPADVTVVVPVVQ